jgi:hypothetical protein
MATLESSASLAVDLPFVNKVTAAVQRLAVTKGQAILVAAEPGPNDKLRLTLAKAAILDPDVYGQRFAWALAAMATMTATPTDADVEAAVDSVWDLIAGVTI